LNNFLARDLTCVGHIYLYFERLIRRNRLRTQSQIVVFERSVRKSMTKWEEWGNFLLIIVAIANKDSFAITNLAVLTWIIDVGRIILQPDRERSGQFSRGIFIPEQNIGEGIALFLAVVPELQHGRDVLDPWHFNGGTNV